MCFLCLPLTAADPLKGPGRGHSPCHNTNNVRAPTPDWQLCLQMGDFERAVEDCDSVLGMKQDTKALLRRGMALAALDELPRAKDDFVNVLSMEPNNRCGIYVHAELHCKEVAGRLHPLQELTLQIWIMSRHGCTLRLLFRMCPKLHLHPARLHIDCLPCSDAKRCSTLHGHILSLNRLWLGG